MSDYAYPQQYVKPTRWLILTYIREYVRAFGLLPARKHIAAAFGISRQRVYYFCWSLEKDGLL